jgi:Rieske Fe-S protein
MAGSTLAVTLSNCTAANKAVAGTISGADLVVPVKAFLISENKYKRYIIVRHDQLQFPICVYRFSETDYTALLMKCTHQGAELQVFGDKLECPAHGSEFSNRGVVETAPADTNLRSFPISINNNELRITLQ